MLQDAVRAAAGAQLGLPVGAGWRLDRGRRPDAVPGDIDDDMAILVLRSSPTDLASRERVFPAEPIMVSEARRLAATTFASWEMDPDQADLACLLVSEVVTNAVLHAAATPSPGRAALLQMASSAATTGAPAGGHGGAMTDAAVPGAAAVGALSADATRSSPGVPLRLRRGGDSVWVEVFDPDLRLPRIRSAGATDEGGRGLYLVEQLATRWGSRPDPGRQGGLVRGSPGRQAALAGPDL